MEFKKYAHYGTGNEIVEATGLECRDGDNLGELLPVFKIVDPSPGRNAGEIAIYRKKLLKGFKKISASGLRHPLIKEIGEKLKDDPEFAETLIKFFVMAIGASNDGQKKKVFSSIKKYVPVELLATFETFCYICPSR